MVPRVGTSGRRCDGRPAGATMDHMTESLSAEHYTATLIDHFEHPRNAGAMAGADAEAFVTNPVCGDSLRLFLRFDGERIAAASFLSSGCPAAIATSSVATELVLGRTADEAGALTRDDFAAAVGGLPKSKVHCSVLAAAAVRNAITAWRAQRGTSP
ncbi:MAG: iron-sulfur cluster assembly scaffold protein [Dehalococcoidia bacterium]|nr:iron-sulfur cluster assembly scaffold protein [Dehalococcoidia bacterium]